MSDLNCKVKLLKRMAWSVTEIEKLSRPRVTSPSIIGPRKTRPLRRLTATVAVLTMLTNCAPYLGADFAAVGGGPEYCGADEFAIWSALHLTMALSR